MCLRRTEWHTKYASNLQQNISQPNPASGLGQINVGQPALRSSSIIVPDPRTQALVSAGKI